jgi:hypothetical protein
LRSYTWACGQFLDQRAEGACVGFAFTHELIAKPKVYQGIDENFARTYYREFQKHDEWPGEAYEGTSVLAGAKVLTRDEFYLSYAWAQTVDDLAMAVAYKGPAVLGINWHDGMWDTGPGGYIEPTGAVMGGHAILCNGFNVNRDAFRLHNSWGQHWGENGGAWLKREHLRQLFVDGGEACIPLRAPYAYLAKKADRIAERNSRIITN